ncbi:hypothetical protein J2795_003142 [Chryseobacterium bernardetii]|uniref:Uncharacterized protein n=1 Tax=Chryseobacterium bernardetii TaxID=1241978 RepID=A0ACC6IXN8_9FLAO|nr:hypothetical protein [Chryseobacterium bernardetii]
MTTNILLKALTGSILNKNSGAGSSASRAGM